MTDFTPPPLIASTSSSIRKIGNFDLRLVDDSRVLWLLLIPEIADVREWHHLPQEMRYQMIELATGIAEILQEKTKADKMNIATIGNIVPEMHLHIIARHKDDFAWPAPVWGNGAALARDAASTKAMIEDLTSWLSAITG